MSLSYDWYEVFGWIGHDEGHDYSPAVVFEFAVDYGYDDALSNRDQSDGLEPCAA